MNKKWEWIYCYVLLHTMNTSEWCGGGDSGGRQFTEHVSTFQFQIHWMNESILMGLNCSILDYWAPGLHPSSGILYSTHSRNQTSSTLTWEGGMAPMQVGLLERNKLNHCTNGPLIIFIWDIRWQSTEIQQHYCMKLQEIQSTGKGVRYIHIDATQAIHFMKGKSNGQVCS